MDGSVESYHSEIASVQAKLSRLRDRAAKLTNEEMNKGNNLAEKQRLFQEMMGRGQNWQYDRDRVEQASRELQEIRRQGTNVATEIAGAMNELSRFQEGLRKAEAQERETTAVTSLPSTDQRPPVTYDVFISHASEDKDGFVRPLAGALESLGCKVWYDESQLRVGDSLRRSIDNGLAHSRFGVVVLSSAFFAKNWPQYELDGLVTLENRGRKVILPIWHKVSRDEVISYSPSLADKVALNSAVFTVQEIAAQLAEVIASGR